MSGNTEHDSLRRSEVYLGEVYERMAGARILIAGCGADGSHAAVRIASILHACGGEITLADPDRYAEGNVGIQAVNVGDVGTNKALALAAHLENTFPGVKIVAHPSGVTHENVAKLVQAQRYVIDAIDIGATGMSEVLHAQAEQCGIPIVVPWSLGQGAALMAFTASSQFVEWGESTASIARNNGAPELADIARWLVDSPHGLTMSYLRLMLKGEVPTPTTYDGAAAGGALAASWIVEHALGHNPETYPNVYVHNGGLMANTAVGDYETLTAATIRELIERG